MEGHSPDGGLHAWEEIADGDWDALLVGNGLSINISPKFAYESLYGEAERAGEDGPLDARDLAVFECFDTANFEVALAKLRDSIAMAEALGQPAASYRKRFSSVQEALGATVRGVHLKRSQVPDSSLATIKQELQRYGSIVSTSYDLILYWATGHQEDFGSFRDCFWGPDNSFDPRDCEIWDGNSATYFVHGALHLVVDGNGRTRKLTGVGQTLLEQFGKPTPSDPEARPLLVTEVSMARDELDRRERQYAILGKLKTKAKNVCFFDAATHPLGAPELRRTVPWRGFRPNAKRIGRPPLRERA